MGLLKIPAAERTRFRRRLLAWFAVNQRDLPWRRTRDAYRIWLSEIMLQQTRVAAVLPYYRRFLARFPSVRALARASVEEVLRRWADLGYYSRARSLHRAAKEIVKRHGGKFPRDPAAALALPGIGRYTAAAVLSIAYDAPLAVLDGNVARVLARLGAIRGDLRMPRRWRQLENAAQELLAPKTPGDWNQAMMELGATVCTPKSPRCSECPVAKWCRARALGIVEQVPVARNKRTPVKITLAAAVLLDARGRTLLVRQNGRVGMLFSNLWQFPAVEVARDAASEMEHHLHEALGIGAAAFAPLDSARHTVTFREIRLAPFLVRVARLPSVAGARAPRLAQLERLPISSATQKIASAALKSLTAPRKSER